MIDAGGRAREPGRGARRGRRGGGARPGVRRARSRSSPPSSTSRATTCRRSREAGITLVGENRTDALHAKQRGLRGRVPVGLHRPPAEPQGARRGRPRRAHPRALEPSRPRARSTRAPSSRRTCWSRSTSAADPAKEGVAPADLDAFLELLAGLAERARRGPDDDAGVRGEPEASRPAFAALRELAAGAAERWRGHARVRRAVDGHEPGLRRGRGRGSDRSSASAACSTAVVRPRDRPVVYTSAAWEFVISGTARWSTSDWRRTSRITTTTRRSPPRQADVDRTYQRALAASGGSSGRAGSRSSRHRRDLLRRAGTAAAPPPHASRRPASHADDAGRDHGGAAARHATREEVDDGGEGAPDRAAVVQRRAADRRPLQERDPGDHQPADGRARAVEAPDRLRLRPHLRARRRHAAHRREGLPADAEERRGVGRGPRAPGRERLLQPAAEHAVGSAVG